MTLCWMSLCWVSLHSEAGLLNKSSRLAPASHMWFLSHFVVLLKSDLNVQQTHLNNPLKQGILKGGSNTVPLTSCLTGLESAVWQPTFFVFICKTDKSKPVKQEVNGTAILPPLVFPDLTHLSGIPKLLCLCSKLVLKLVKPVWSGSAVAARHLPTVWDTRWRCCLDSFARPESNPSFELSSSESVVQVIKLLGRVIYSLAK